MRAVFIPAIAILAPFTAAPDYGATWGGLTSANTSIQADAVILNDVAAMRSAAEAAVSRHLIDPTSAIFEWPYPFIKGRWQTILKGHYYDGDLTCGFVNAKNRLGGYTGKVFFVVVPNQGKVVFSEVGTGRGRGRDFVSDSCTRSAAALSSPA